MFLIRPCLFSKQGCRADTFHYQTANVFLDFFVSNSNVFLQITFPWSGLFVRGFCSLQTGKKIMPQSTRKRFSCRCEFGTMLADLCLCPTPHRCEWTLLDMGRPSIPPDENEQSFWWRRFGGKTVDIRSGKFVANFSTWVFFFPGKFDGVTGSCVSNFCKKTKTVEHADVRPIASIPMLNVSQAEDMVLIQGMESTVCPMHVCSWYFVVEFWWGQLRSVEDNSFPGRIDAQLENLKNEGVKLNAASGCVGASET